MRRMMIFASLLLFFSVAQLPFVESVKAGSEGSWVYDFESPDMFSQLQRWLAGPVRLPEKKNWGNSAKSENGFNSRCNGHNKVYFEGGRKIFCN